MKDYFVNNNPQITGEHEVHTEDCYYLKIAQSKTRLGTFYSCHGAMIEARKHYYNVDGCKYCCPDCHKR
ncbi:MAG: hypothetical protein ACOYEG_14410 [Petrimonas sp.]|jgi:hypothetical protein